MTTGPLGITLIKEAHSTRHGTTIAARFDDLRPMSARCFALDSPLGVIVAREMDEVRPAIEDAERAATEGAWVAGFIAYEAAPALDASLDTRPPPHDLPLAWFGVFGAHREVPPVAAPARYRLDPWRPETREKSYLDDIDSIRERIAAGDSYQVNYTMRLRSRFEGDPLALYSDLAESQRGGYAAYLDTGEHWILSASPELFFRWEGERIVTRPMKGTAARGRWWEEDTEARERLVATEKERAENVMIVDLLRADLGKVAGVGTVAVEDLFSAERYDTLWQLTSTVSAQVRHGTALIDVLAATFPSGSVTGAPKRRTMEIIAELERSPRGVYCGAVGILAPPGSGEPRAIFSVAIRTVSIEQRSGKAEYGIGGGITYDSDPRCEHDEALLKAQILTPRRPVELLETLRWDPVEGFWLLERHMDRLRRSAEYFGLRFDEPELRSTLASFLAESPRRVRLLVAADGVRIETEPLSLGPVPLALAIDAEPVDVEDPLRYHKTRFREGYDAARARHPEADDVVLVTRGGGIAETTVGNLAARVDGRWLTPPLSSGCLPGVYRAELLETGELVERELSVEDLGRAEGLAVINSVRGWRDATLLPDGDP